MEEKQKTIFTFIIIIISAVIFGPLLILNKDNNKADVKITRMYGPSGNKPRKEGPYLGMKRIIVETTDSTKVVIQKNYASDDSTIVYEKYSNYKNRKLVRVKEIKENGTFYTEYEYDSRGNCIKETLKDENEQIYRYATMTFKNDSLDCRIDYDANGKELARHIQIPSTDGSLFSVKTIPDKLPDTLTYYFVRRKDYYIKKLLDFKTGLWEYHIFHNIEGVSGTSGHGDVTTSFEFDKYGGSIYYEETTSE